MSIKRITAIAPVDLLDELERHLRECGVSGVTVEHVQGYGEHPNFFRRDLMHENVRLLLYAKEENVDRIVAAITACAKQCCSTAGILTVESIDRMVSLVDGADVVT